MLLSAAKKDRVRQFFIIVILDIRHQLREGVSFHSYSCIVFGVRYSLQKFLLQAPRNNTLQKLQLTTGVCIITWLSGLSMVSLPFHSGLRKSFHDLILPEGTISRLAAETADKTRDHLVRRSYPQQPPPCSAKATAAMDNSLWLSW